MKSSLDAIAYWLIDYYIAATVVLTVVTVAQRMIGQPVRRLALHWGTLMGLSLLAVFCALPGWPRIDVMNVARAIPEAVSQSSLKASHKVASARVDPGGKLLNASSPTSIAASNRQRLPKSNLRESSPIANGGQGAKRDVAATAAAGPEGLFRRLVDRDLGPARLFALAIFAVGSVLTTLRVIHGVLAARKVRLSASEAPQRVIAELEKLAGTVRCPELLVSRSHPVPIVIGTLRPKILLPPQFAEKERPDDCRSVLAHELAHIQNGDLWLLALDRWLLPLFWLHPLYLRLRRSFRDDQELLADTFAASHSSRTDYADMLVRWARRLLAEKQARQLAAAVGVWERPTRLADRVSRILHQNPRLELDCSRAWRIGSLLLLIALPIVLSTATVRPDVPRSSNFVSQLIAQSLVTPKSACCHRTSGLTPSDLDDGIQYLMEQPAIDLMERPAIVQIQRLGGSAKKERIGSKWFVTEVNLVFRYTQDGHRVENKIFTDEALPHIAKLRHLKALAVAGGQITDGGLRRLSALTELQGLNLRDARLVSSAGVAVIAKFPKLRRLELTNAPIDDAAFAKLAAVRTLEDLSVEGSDLSDESLTVAASLPDLKSLSLDIRNRMIGRKALLSLHALPNLKRLSLRCSEITDEALLEIQSLTNLRFLSLGESRVSVNAVASLRQSLPNLAVQTAQKTLRPRSDVSSEQTGDDARRSDEVLSKVRNFTRCVGRSRLRAAQLMTIRPAEAQYRVYALRAFPSLTNVDWKLAYLDSDAALAVSSEFSNRFGATSVFTCRLRSVGDEWKIEDLDTTSVCEGVEKTVVRFASAFPKARATDEWLAFPANVR